MVDLATLRSVPVAAGGSRGDVVVTTSDGRVLLSQSHQVDVLKPSIPPGVVAVSPPDASIVALPWPGITVTFDQDMLVAESSDARSVTAPENYILTGVGAQSVVVRLAEYDAETRTVRLTVDGLAPAEYELRILSSVSSIENQSMLEDHVTHFTAVSDLSWAVGIEFASSRLDRGTSTVSYEVEITNTTQRELLLPVLLVLDPAEGYAGVPLHAAGQAPDGRWFIDLSQSLPSGQALMPGETTVGRTISIENPGDLRVDFDPGVSATPAPNEAPVIDSAAAISAAVGQPYSYRMTAHDPDGWIILYLLYTGPDGMSVDPDTGLVSWTPTSESPARAEVVLQVYDNGFAQATPSGQHRGRRRKPPAGNRSASATVEGAEGRSIEVHISASDPDGDRLTFGVEKLPGGAVFDVGRQSLLWTPDYDAAGTYEDVKFIVSDGLEFVRAHTTFVIAPTNRLPYLLRPPDRVLREGQPTRFTLRGGDDDGDEVTYFSRFAPPGMTLDPGTGVVEWTPAFDQAGAYDVPFGITDGTEMSSLPRP